MSRRNLLQGPFDVGFMLLPKYRIFVVVASLLICFGTWYLFERTKLGAYLRAGTENPKLLQAFGINVPVMITLTYGFGVALAGIAGVLAAPIMQVTPLMGGNLAQHRFRGRRHRRARVDPRFDDHGSRRSA